ncbi:hypothetical protein [Marinagarivorans algicola]|uniref:hypothetical protein n=1 Tax=Marinagarivorans algicola TaxID=1513270 RepID=UPI003734F21E
MNNQHVMPLASPESYTFINGHYALFGKYLAISGCICDDPTVGASVYNQSLIKFLNAKPVNVKDRVIRLFNKYSDNRRVQAVKNLLASSEASIDASDTGWIEKTLLMTYLSVF